MVLTIVNKDGKKDVHSVHHPVFTAQHQPQIVQPKRPFGTVGGWVRGGFRGWHWHWGFPPSLVWISFWVWCWWGFGTVGSAQWLTAGSTVYHMSPGDTRMRDGRPTPKCFGRIHLDNCPSCEQWSTFLAISPSIPQTQERMREGGPTHTLMDLPGQGRVPRPN